MIKEKEFDFSKVEFFNGEAFRRAAIVKNEEKEKMLFTLKLVYFNERKINVVQIDENYCVLLIDLESSEKNRWNNYLKGLKEEEILDLKRKFVKVRN